MLICLYAYMLYAYAFLCNDEAANMQRAKCDKNKKFFKKWIWQRLKDLSIRAGVT